MRSSRKLASILCAIACLLAGCGALQQQKPGTLAIRTARLGGTADAPMLEIGLDCRLSGPMQDALDHGIPLVLAVDADSGRWALGRRAQSTHRIELRYFPLSRRYQLRDFDGPGEARSYATPAYLLAGLNSLRLPVPAAFASLPRDASLRVRAHFETAALPGALRLPAMFEPAWRLSAAEYTWQPAA